MIGDKLLRTGIAIDVAFCYNGNIPKRRGSDTSDGDPGSPSGVELSDGSILTVNYQKYPVNLIRRFTRQNGFY